MDIKKSNNNRNLEKPIILAVETSGRCGSIALVTPGLCLAEYTLNSSLTHSRRLLSAIDEILRHSALELGDLAGLAVSLGPGSFTGLRIGLSSMKGLAMATELPFIGVPTLDALANQLPFAAMPVCPLVDARKNEVFTAWYHWQAGEFIRDSAYLAMNPEKLIEHIKEPTIFIGDGLAPYRELIHEKLGDLALFAPSETCYARASGIGRLALSRWFAQDFSDLKTATPLYVRASEAELQFEKEK